ncbi:MAG: ImmA/IrrE family metallo-endopeptidase [Thermodesulfobacteriota bacterium]
MSSKIAFKGTYEDIEALAGALRKLVLERMGQEHPRAGEMVRWTTEKLGGEIKVSEDPSKLEEESGSLAIYRKGRFVIFLSPYTSPLRDNFTIAHEIGHYFLHFDHKNQPSNGPVIFNRYGSGRDEWQANRFAAAFLMPKEEFLEVYERYGRNTRLVAGHFEVSEPAVQVRAIYIVPKR